MALAGRGCQRQSESESLVGHELSKFPAPALQELARLEDEANQLVAITVASKKTARGGS